MSVEKHQCPVAIVGMSCFFPKSAGLKAYWRLLRQGLDAITEVPASHWRTSDYYDPDPKRPDHVYCTRGGFLPALEFDPSEFGIPPSALEATDSSQLLALAAARHALEDAGLAVDRARTSVILGVTGTQELVIPLSSRLGHPHWRRALAENGVAPELAEAIVQRIADAYVPWQENSFPGLLGNVVAGRISNRLDLGGTNCVVDAACASSMAAVHLALLELGSGLCDTVITGGADTLNDIFMHMCFSKTQILSPTGDVRPFSRNADGTLLGEGIGLLVLKRLPDAERDGNRIYAVIKGIGSSSDGRSQSIYAPCIDGQVNALTAAYAAAGVDPATVGLIEAHGTGTRVGDKVEFQALCRVMGASPGTARRCALGSVKSMIGHTKAAAGAAGLVKAVLALHHKVLPATLKAEDPDPALDVDRSPFYLNSRTRPWLSPPGQPRRAGVSSFGFGGSNFHLVLEEHLPEKPRIAWDGSVQLLAFSAEEIGALRGRVREFAAAADGWSEAEFSHRAGLSRAGFSHRHEHRLLAVIEAPRTAGALLTQALPLLDEPGGTGPAAIPNVYFGRGPAPGGLALLFPGQGSQYPGMMSALACLFPSALAVFENADRLAAAQGLLSDVVFPPSGRDSQNAAEALRATETAQPAIGAACLAALRALAEFGIRPDAVGGHSFGELTALCAAGWMDEPTFFGLAAARGRAMARAGAQGRGTMAAVRGPLAEIEALIAREKIEVVLANRNSPAQAVLSGAAAAVAEAERLCRQNGFTVKTLAVGGAFHSPLMRAAQEEFAGQVAQAEITPTDMPVFSNVAARTYPRDADAARRLLAEHLGRPVDFIGQIEAMSRAGAATFVEVGPKSVLTGLVAAILDGRAAHALALDPFAGRRDGIADLGRVLCRLAALGHAVALERWEEPAPPPTPKRMSVPIHGANYRHAGPQPGGNAAPPRGSSGAAASRAFAATTRAGTGRPEPTTHADAETMRKETPDAMPQTVQDALRSVQEGLKTIQAIQVQTATAHQKFLETQAEATRVLLELVQTTGRLASPPAGVAVEPPADRPAAAAQAAPAPPPAAPAAAAAPDPIGAPAPPAPSGDLNALLLAVVAELTGYPVEMLGLDMDIETDLGIDSIKRVEILSTLEERSPGLRPVAPEDMGRLKTLGQIIAFLSAAPAPALPQAPEAPPSPGAAADSCRFAAAASGGRPAERRVVRLQEAPAAGPAEVAVAKGRKVFVTDDRAGLSQALLAEFGRLGINAVLVSTDILQHRRDLPPAAGLVIVQNPAPAAVEADLKNSFELAQRLAGDLAESARSGGAFFTTVTRMDGAFGFSGRAVANPVQGALAGLAKTAAAEWPEVICRALDIDPEWTDLRAAARAVAAHAMTRGPLEAGLAANGCRTPVLAAEDYPEGALPFQPGEAVVVSGGARGITAACALELARRVRPGLVLLGRSPEPFPEPEWMHGLAAEAEIKAALIEHEFTGQTVRPADVERRLRQLLANREVSHSLAAMASAGASVRYYAVDVRDAGQVRAALADARSRFGPIRGLIHGAGVLEDRLIAAKNMEQFERVFTTKLDGFRSLLEACAPDELKAIVIFSSVTARIGNRGQADYAMANEALNKLAQAESDNRPGCRVVSINWGPWECGMVTASIKREFERQGVTLLPAAEGAIALIRELGRPAGAPVEVVIGGTLNPASMQAAASPRQPLSILFERQIDLTSYPVLGSHVIDGKPVVPLALIAELFGHGALHENPGLILHGLEELRIMSGIRLERKAKRVRLLAGKALRKNGHFEVELELRNGMDEGKEILHSRARAILAEDYAPPPAYRLPDALACNHYPRSPAEIYEKILFHGRQLQGLRGIRCCTADGMVADAVGAPAPVQWMASPLRNSWLADPLVLDAAFQMASLWCYEQRGSVSLPSLASSYRQFRQAFPSEGITVVLEVRDAAGKKMRGDFTFLDAQGEVVARLTGFEAVMDPVLNRAFKPEGTL